jgi:hypothetical protein
MEQMNQAESSMLGAIGQQRDENYFLLASCTPRLVWGE